MRVLIMVVLAAGTVFAAAVSTELVVPPSAVTVSEAAGWDVVEFSRLPAGTAPALVSAPGEPLLPWLSVNVLIPAGAEVEEVLVVPLERTELGSLRLHPAQPMRPLSQFASVPFVGPDAAVYQADNVFPAQPVQAVPAGNKAGFRIAGLLWCPFEYRPASGRLTLVSRARVEVRYRAGALPVAALSESQRSFFAADVAGLVANPADVDRMAPPVVARDLPDLDVVIFTSTSLAPALQPLQSWLQRKGYFTTIVAQDTLSRPGRDVPEKMRNLVKELFARRGLKYVILGGDNQVCPLRYGYLPYSTYTVPADMYFADIDGSWDANNNGQFGEMSGDSLDLFQDLYVGRLPLDNAAHAATFLTKDTIYELHPDTAYLNNVILPSEWLWQNIDYSGRIVNRNVALLLEALGTWQVESALGMTPATVVAGLNAGRQHFHFAGHGSRTAFGSTFSTSNLSSLNNLARPSVVTSMACDCGWFDDGDCLGEDFVTAASGGAVATMLNARYGWGAPPCQGPNENLNCEFYRNYIRGRTVGQAHGMARDFLRNESFSQMTTRWAMYTNTLQGDPTMRMWRRPPTTLSVTAPDTVPAAPAQLTVTVSSGAEPVSGARVALTHRGELLGRGVTDAAGVARFPVTAPGDTWTLELSVTAPDAAFYCRTVAVGRSCPGPLVVLDHASVDDGNGRLDPGEESDVYLTVRNLGAAAADSTTGRLVSHSPWVSVVVATADYGSVAALDTAKGSAYRLAVSRDCPHGHRAELVLVTASGGTEWQSAVELVVGMPFARSGVWATLDTGDYCLTLVANGGIGTTQWRGEGFGFIYPKSRQWSSSALMHGSLLLGIDTGWVADNYYGAPDWRVCPQDFATTESLRIHWPPQLGDQQYDCRFSDSRHPAPRGIVVRQRAFGSARPSHKDFAILEYCLYNTGSSAVNGLWAGIGADFRTAGWNSNDQYDYAGVDSLRTLAYIRAQPETLCLGVRPIWPRSAGGWANCINQTVLDDGFTKSEKLGYLNGTLRSVAGGTIGNWHAVVSSGPYYIPAGDSQVVAFVLVGGRTVAQAAAVSDTAANWYDPPTAVSSPLSAMPLVRRCDLMPAVSDGRVTLRYSISRLEPLELQFYDAIGREVGRLGHQPARLEGQLSLVLPAGVPGVWFVRIGDYTGKVAVVR